MDETVKGPRIGKRHVQIFLMFALLSIAFAMRVQLAVALVAMTERSTSNPDIPVFDWDNNSVILSSFYWGYLWLQILAGNLGRVYGTKYFLMGSMTINATICCLIPTITMKWGSYGLMAIRVLQGLSQGFFYPSLNDVMSKWSPSSERSSLGNLAYSGSHFGTIITMPLVAVISTTWYGWPLSFYLYGGVGFLWVIAFYFFGYSSPATHPSISIEEKEYIENDLDIEGYKEKIPWTKILSNVPFWAAFITQVGQYYCGLVLLLETPTYLNKVMEFDLTANGFLSASPYFGSFVVLLLSGQLADYIINNDKLSLIWTRKIFTIIGCVIPGISVLALGFLPKDAKTISVVMLIVASSSQMFSGSGAVINHIDLSPNFAGVLMGIINSSGTVVSIFGPVAVQFIVQDNSDISEWRIIFIITAVVYILPCVFFLIFASAEIQSFDSSKGISMEERKKRLKKHSVISVMSM